MYVYIAIRFIDNQIPGTWSTFGVHPLDSFLVNSKSVSVFIESITSCLVSLLDLQVNLPLTLVSFKVIGSEIYILFPPCTVTFLHSVFIEDMNCLFI